MYKVRNGNPVGVRENYTAIIERISAACRNCTRQPDEVKIVAVSKTKPVSALQEALQAGVAILGENRVQEAKTKWPEIEVLARERKAEFHLVGHLQRNKAREAVRLFDLIHSLDSVRLAEELDRRAGEIGKVQRVLIEVNTSGDETKYGVAPADVKALLEAAQQCMHLQVEGLMTIGPLFGGLHGARESFQILRQLRNDLGGADLLPELSMGMTQDFEIAIEEGATLVRIGTAIFGSRN